MSEGLTPEEQDDLLGEIERRWMANPPTHRQAVLDISHMFVLVRQLQKENADARHDAWQEGADAAVRYFHQREAGQRGMMPVNPYKATTDPTT